MLGWILKLDTCIVVIGDRVVVGKGSSDGKTISATATLAPAVAAGQQLECRDQKQWWWQ